MEGNTGWQNYTDFRYTILQHIICTLCCVFITPSQSLSPFIFLLPFSTFPHHPSPQHSPCGHCCPCPLAFFSFFLFYLSLHPITTQPANLISTYESVSILPVNLFCSLFFKNKMLLHILISSFTQLWRNEKYKRRECCLKLYLKPFLVWLSWLEHGPIHQKIKGSIPHQSTYLGCGFNPQLVHTSETSN